MAVLPGVLAVAAGFSGVVEAAGPRVLSFSTPAKTWDSEALPIGNGSAGAMIFGSPWAEEHQFNDITLWTGGDNLSGSYDINKFGSYQNFGSLRFSRTSQTMTSPNEAAHNYQWTRNNKVDKSADGTDAKWCFVHNTQKILWQAELAQPAVVSRYTLRSAEDVPERDPKSWVFQGSQDGKSWTTLDTRDLTATSTPVWPFAGRNQDQGFDFTNSTAYKFYRFEFTPNTAVPHFQVAEITLDGLPKNPTVNKYSRALDLSQALHQVGWVSDGVTHSRETFASHPHQVLVTRWTASKPGAITTDVMLAGAHEETTVAEKNTVSFASSLKNNGLRYATEARVVAKGGNVSVSGNRLIAENCDELMIYHAAATDYAMDATTTPPFRSGKDPAAVVDSRLDVAIAAGYAAVKSAHLADYQALYQRATLDLGPAPAVTAMPERLANYRKGAADPDLEALVFDFGRYLLISSSRDSLPANLQGLWNNTNTPPWMADYHVNINLQMNYWGAEPTNLSECALPLFRLLEAMAPLSRAATKTSFGANKPGWTMRTSFNPFGGHGWQWDKPSSGWLMRHFWDHYLFTQDKTWLRKSAWPLMKEVCQFFLSELVEDANGKLVTPKGWSPEHGPRENGVSYEQEIVWDLFHNAIAACDVLGDEAAFRAELVAAKARLLVPALGTAAAGKKYITEWANPATEAAHGYGNAKGHRHTSHLYALYPGSQFNPRDTPEYVAAGINSLADRGTSGDSRQSWTWPWRIALWGRMNQPAKAQDMIRGYLTYNTWANLLAYANGVYQIDGPLGMSGVMSELLLQSHFGEIAILPALPPGWAAQGSFTGMRARSGVTVDANWNEGRITRMKLRSDADQTLKLRVPANTHSELTLRNAAGQKKIMKLKDQVVEFAAKAGTDYEFFTDKVGAGE